MADVCHLFLLTWGWGKWRGQSLQRGGGQIHKCPYAPRRHCYSFFPLDRRWEDILYIYPVYTQVWYIKNLLTWHQSIRFEIVLHTKSKTKQNKTKQTNHRSDILVAEWSTWSNAPEKNNTNKIMWAFWGKKFTLIFVILKLGYPGWLPPSEFGPGVRSTA